MTRLALNKSELQKINDKLSLYQRVLPSLDLKHKQLLAERNMARRELEGLSSEMKQLYDRTLASIPMMANNEINLSGLVKIENVHVTRHNLLGVSLPVVEAVDCSIRKYSLMARPHWVDHLAVSLKHYIELRIRIQIQQQRIEILTQALRKTLQRVNLLEKVLMPEARQQIHKIKIALADAERASVIRAKMAKSRRMVTA